MKANLGTNGPFDARCRTQDVADSSSVGAVKGRASLNASILYLLRESKLLRSDCFPTLATFGQRIASLVGSGITTHCTE